MKKLLIATTALVATAGVAAADVSVSGLGRYGVVYEKAKGAASDTSVDSRLRFNIDATKETDTGITFGARLRLQNDDQTTETKGNAAQFHVTYEGLRVELGNVNTAADSVALTYNSEMGFEASSYGDADTSIYAYDSKSNNSGDADALGVAAFYSIAGANLYLSYVDPKQNNNDKAEEVGVAADYTFEGFTVAGAYTDNVGGNDVATHLFLGAAYGFGDANVGVNFYQNKEAAGKAAVLDQVTLWGDYTFGDVTLQAYVSEQEKASDTAFGLGASYKLADGVKIAGAYQQGYAEQKKADIGLQFNF